MRPVLRHTLIGAVQTHCHSPDARHATDLPLCACVLIECLRSAGCEKKKAL